MRYMNLFGCVDDIFAKYRKEECTPDSEWTPYCFYNEHADYDKEDYSVYCGAVTEELKLLIEHYQKDQKIKFTDSELKELFDTLEIAPNQDNDNDAWTDIMFRSKFYFTVTLYKILDKYDVAG